ncbi:uncharacterized protein LOC133779029 [Humulus lupulus]|uniref:uncharacterized protein LOC133779029 n=1 Tax=Humulus lupulus TaxID=3486 RepID=UPI002B408FB4|nr:uncharacterized protein LOC133779029 [Humulus lupulus]
MTMYYQHCYVPQINRYEPYSNNYNSQWEEYPNTFCGGNQYVEPNYYSQPEYNEFTPQYSDPSIGDLINALNASTLQLQQMSEQAYGPFPQQSPTGISQDQEPSISDMLKILLASTMQTQVILQSTEASLKSLESTMGQIVTSLNNREVKNIGELPTELESNPIENDSTLTLQSGPQLDMPPYPNITFDIIPTQEVNNSTPGASSPPEIETFTSVGPSSQNMLHKPTVRSYVPIPPFPSRLTKFKNEEENKVILKINISLHKTTKQVPPHAKLPKELSKNKRKLKGDKKMSVGENVSVILQRKLLPKCQDLGMSINSYTINKSRFDPCMIDLGARIDVMSYSIFASLNLGLLKETSVIIQLADHANAYPLRVVEDVLVQVLFGRPFLMTTNTKMDVRAGTLTMEFDGDVIKFNVFDSPGKIKGKETSLNDPP